MMRKRQSILWVTVLTCALYLSSAVTTSHYVLFTNGRLHVFPDSCLAQWANQDGILSFTALDGSTFTYDMNRVASFDDVEPRELPSITSFKINNKFNYQVVTDAVGVIDGDFITLDVVGIGKRLTPTFALSQPQAVAWVDGNVQSSKESRLRFDGDVVYTVGYPGDQVLTPDGKGSYALRQYGRNYTVQANFLTDQATTVPRIDITTVGGENISSKEYYLNAEIIIDGAGVFPSMTDSVMIKGHGNSSWSADDPTAKNPYRLKFASKRKPLGLTNGKNWILLANKAKGSMMTNAIGMKAASLLGLPAPNHIIPVDLYINGVYKGSYNLTEKTGLANNSIEVPDETVAAFLDLDRYFDEALTQMFASPIYILPVIVKDPEFDEDETQLTLNIIKQRFNAFESDVSNNRDIEPHVDMEALARFMVMNEYILNYEIMWPKSTKLYHPNLLSDTAKFVFGPAWDLDHAFGFETNSNFFYASTSKNFYDSPITRSGWRFFSALHNRSDVGNLIYRVWRSFMEEGLDEMCEFCQDYYEYAAPSLNHNTEAWSNQNFNYQYQSQLASTWLRSRAEDLLTQIAAAFMIRGDVNNDGEIGISDVTRLISYLLNGDTTGVDLLAADMDNDGEVGIADVTAIIRFLLGLN